LKSLLIISILYKIIKTGEIELILPPGTVSFGITQ